MPKNIPAPTWPDLDTLEDAIVNHPDCPPIYEVMLDAVAAEQNARHAVLMQFAEALHIPVEASVTLN